MSDQFNSDATVEHMTRVYGSRFAACPCGREAVLLYRRTQEGETLNDSLSDRLTYHDTPQRRACPHGGRLLTEVATILA